MVRRYVVLFNDPPAWATKALADSVQAVGGTYWHWYRDCWLISDPKGHDLRFWAAVVLDTLPDVQHLILEAAGPWTGWSSKDHFKWFDQVWGPPIRR